MHEHLLPARTYSSIHLAFYSVLCRGAGAEEDDRGQRHGVARIEPMTRSGASSGKLADHDAILRQNQRPQNTCGFQPAQIRNPTFELAQPKATLLTKILD